jgi:hypothetical protein
VHTGEQVSELGEAVDKTERLAEPAQAAQALNPCDGCLDQCDRLASALGGIEDLGEQRSASSNRSAYTATVA